MKKIALIVVTLAFMNCGKSAQPYEPKNVETIQSKIEAYFDVSVDVSFYISDKTQDICGSSAECFVEDESSIYIEESKKDDCLVVASSLTKAAMNKKAKELTSPYVLSADVTEFCK